MLLCVKRHIVLMQFPYQGATEIYDLFVPWNLILQLAYLFLFCKQIHDKTEQTYFSHWHSVL